MLSTRPRASFEAAPLSQLSSTVKRLEKQKPMTKRIAIQASGSIYRTSASVPAAEIAAKAENTRMCPTRAMSRVAVSVPRRKPMK